MSAWPEEIIQIAPAVGFYALYTDDAGSYTLPLACWVLTKDVRTGEQRVQGMVAIDGTRLPERHPDFVEYTTKEKK